MPQSGVLRGFVSGGTAAPKPILAASKRFCAPKPLFSSLRHCGFTLRRRILPLTRQKFERVVFVTSTLKFSRAAALRISKRQPFYRALARPSLSLELCLKAAQASKQLSYSDLYRVRIVTISSI